MALILALALARAAGAAPITVCTFTFHNPGEVGVFKSRLPADQFEVLDLAPSPIEAASAGDWLGKLCQKDLRCDVVVYSAEFAGRFFGKYGSSVSVQDLDEAACQASCGGLFHTPQEVFLLACNTLATKGQDRRTPHEYLEVLLDHGFDRASAERVVALRYGPLGPSFRESLRRIFAGVPRIYGFSSVAPTAEYTVPMLERYFHAKGDYQRYLARSQGDLGPNRELLTAFRGTGMVQAQGLSPAEPAAADRREICALYDEHRSVGDRLRIVKALMDRDDFLAFVPTIEVFVSRHPPADLDDDDRALFETIKARTDARDRVLKLVHDLNVSALQLEIAHLALLMEWMTPDEFRRLAVDGERQLLQQPLTSENVDITCEIGKHQPLGDDFKAGDIPALYYTDAEGIHLIDCLAPRDEHVTERLLAGLDSGDVQTRLWAGYTISHRLPLTDAVLVRLAAHLDDPSPDLRLRLRWIFGAQQGLSDDVVEAIAARDPSLAVDVKGHRRRR